MLGLKLTKKSSRNFATGYQNLATFSRRIFALHFHALQQKNMSPQYLCKKNNNTENGE